MSKICNNRKITAPLTIQTFSFGCYQSQVAVVFESALKHQATSDEFLPPSDRLKMIICYVKYTG